MSSALLGVQALALFGMIAVSFWGWQHIAPETRVRARAGPTGIDYTMGKNTTLISTPLIGLFIFIGTLATRNADEGETGELLGLAVMLIFLASHIAAVRRAAR